MSGTPFTWAVALGHGDGPAVFWCASIVVALAYSVRSARRSLLDPRAAYWAGLAAICVGVCGSRLLGMAVYGDGGSLALKAVIIGGHSYYGGLLAGAAAAVLYLRARGAPWLRHVDAMVPAVALGYAIGRVGCFLNGCDYGVLVHGAFAVRYPQDSEAFVAQLQRGLVAPWQALSLPVLPVQLLDAAFSLLLFLFLRRDRGRPGWRAGLFAVLSGAARFASELVRGDFAAVAGPLSLHQAISLCLAALGLLLLASTRNRAAAVQAAS